MFEKFPEWPIKNNIRYFLAFNSMVPKSIQDLSPIKGYEMYRKLQEGDIVVDAGAFTGDYTIFAAKKVGPNGLIIAFEPDEKNRKILAHNIEHSKLNNVIIVPKGLWNENGLLNITSDGLHSMVGVPSKDYDANTFTQIEVCRLDDELKRLNIPKVDVIKMDIEGAEIEAIQGCVETLRDSDPFIIIASYHIVDGVETKFFLEDYFRDIKYKAISDFPKHTTTYACKTTFF